MKIETLFVAGDTGPALTGTITSGGAPVDLAGAVVWLRMQRPDGTILLREATVTDAAAGAWSYSWQSGELTAGGWKVDVETTLDGTVLQTTPAPYPLMFDVRGRLSGGPGSVTPPPMLDLSELGALRDEATTARDAAVAAREATEAVLPSLSSTYVPLGAFSGAAVASRPPLAVANLLTNPEMATDATNWATSGYGTGGTGTSVRTAGVGHNGTAGWVVTWTADPTAGGMSAGPYNDRRPVTAGEVYEAAIYVKPSSAAFTVSVRINWYSADSSATLISSDDTDYAVVAGVEQRLIAREPKVAPATATYASVTARIVNCAAVANGDTLIVSCASLHPGSQARPYAATTPTLGARSGIGVAVGDSMVQLASGGGKTLTQHLTDQLGSLCDAIINGGRGGETSQGIAIRQGGYDVRVTFPANQIPASGTASVTVSPEPDLLDGLWTYYGSVGGVQGVLTRAAGGTAWTFTRAVAGTAVDLLPGGAPLKGRNPVDLADWEIIWAGRNDVTYYAATANTARAKVLNAVGAMVARCQAVGQPYLVVSVCNNNVERSGYDRYPIIMQINADLAALYGSAYVDARTYLIAYGLAVAGISPTAADTTAIAEDRIPPSLMYDGTHLNDAGRLVVAKLLAQVLKARVYT